MLFGDDALGSLPTGGNVETDVTVTCAIAAATSCSAAITAVLTVPATVAATTSASSSVAATTTITAQTAATTSTSSSVSASPVIAANVAASTSSTSSIAATPVVPAQIAATTSTSSGVAASPVIVGSIAASTSSSSAISASPVIDVSISGSTSTSASVVASPVIVGTIGASTSTSAAVVAPLVIPRVRPLKLEDTETGSQTDDVPTTFDRNRNFLDARGVAHQDTSSNDHEVRTERDGDDLVFVDLSIGRKTLSDLAATSSGVNPSTITGLRPGSAGLQNILEDIASNAASAAISRSSYTVYSYTDGFVAAIAVYADNTLAVQLSGTAISRDAENRISGTVEVQRNSVGTPIRTVTTTINRVDGLIASVDVVAT